MRKPMIRLLSLLPALMILAGCAGEPPRPTTAPSTAPEDPSTYTFRDYLTGSPACYDPLSWETEFDRYVLRHTTMGLYDMAAGDAPGSYEFIPEMAAGLPRDVSEKYAGNELYGVPGENFAGYAWEIDLNPHAVWEDGTPINADSYLYSMRKLLDPRQKHTSAAAYCTGRFAIRNAQNYLMQDQVGTVTYATLEQLGYKSVEEAREDGYTHFYLDMDHFWHLSCGYVEITDETEYRDETIPEGIKEDTVSAKYLYNKYLKTGKDFSDYQDVYIAVRVQDIQEAAWEDVGIKKSGEYQLTLFLEKPVTVAELQYNLTSNWLVPNDYDSETYGRDSDDYLSYGPYRLESVLPDINLRLVKNEKWYGYTDGKHQGQFQATHIFCRIIKNEDVAIDAFLDGQLDRLSTAGSRVGTEGLTQYILEPQSYTSKLTFNSNFAALKRRQSEGVNKTILSDRQFRQAIAMALDPERIARAVSPIHGRAFGLLNSTYVSDLSTGTSYRQTAQAQTVLDTVNTDTAGLQARDLFLNAYSAAVKAKQITDTDIIRLDFVAYADGAVYQSIAAAVQEGIDKAVSGTELEGRIVIDLVADADYYSRAREGEFEIILSTLGGSTMDPYAMMENYCDPDRCFEYGFDPDTQQLTLTIGDEIITKSYRRWCHALCYGAYARADAQTRTTILAALELGILRQYCCVPVYSRNTAVFYSRRMIPGDGANPNRIWQGSLRNMAFAYGDEK